MINGELQYNIVMGCYSCGNAVIGLHQPTCPSHIKSPVESNLCWAFFIFGHGYRRRAEKHCPYRMGLSKGQRGQGLERDRWGQDTSNSPGLNKSNL